MYLADPSRNHLDLRFFEKQVIIPQLIMIFKTPRGVINYRNEPYGQMQNEKQKT